MVNKYIYSSVYGLETNRGLRLKKNVTDIIINDDRVLRINFILLLRSNTVSKNIKYLIRNRLETHYYQNYFFHIESLSSKPIITNAFMSFVYHKKYFLEPIMIHTNDTYYLQHHEKWLTPLGRELIKHFLNSVYQVVWVDNLIERFFESITYDTNLSKTENTERMDNFYELFNERKTRESSRTISEETEGPPF